MIWLQISIAESAPIHLAVSSCDILRFGRAIQAVSIREHDIGPCRLESAIAAMLESDVLLVWAIAARSYLDRVPIRSLDELKSWLSESLPSLLDVLREESLLVEPQSTDSVMTPPVLHERVHRRRVKQQGIRLAQDKLASTKISPESSESETTEAIDLELFQLWSRTQSLGDFVGPESKPSSVEYFEVGLRTLIEVDSEQCLAFERYQRSLLDFDPANSTLADASDQLSDAGNGDRSPSLLDPESMFSEREAVGFFNETLTLLRRVELLETQFANSLQLAKMSAMKELAYGASHEVNNPLANIATRAQTLLRDEIDPDKRQRLAMINRQAFRAHEMISNMMLFAHPPDLHPEELDLDKLIQSVLSEMNEESEEQGTKLVETSGQDGLCFGVRDSMVRQGLEGVDSEKRHEASESNLVIGDRSHLEVLVKELIRNSLEALGSGGKVEVGCQPFHSTRILSIHETPDSADDTECETGVVIRVCDNGPGIPEEIREKVFDPFFSGREAGRGLGFGLSKAWRIAQLHGGRIEFESQDRTGLSWSVFLPKQHLSNAKQTNGKQSVTS